jgi:type II restriction/modification system DNA methylase subunit YeeA
MNKAKLKSYAPQARKDFIAAVTARANLLGLSDKDGQLQVAPSQPQGDITMIAGQAWPAKIHGQRQQLVARLQKDGFAQTLEAVAYTWFNRFAALRYMELHDYLGHGHRALSSEEGTLPDILTHAANLAESTSLPGLNAAQVIDMKLAGNRDGELYRLLLVAQCNALSVAMPFLFERIDDETELLLPDNLLRTDSVIAKLVSSIDEGDWKEVEIIGWLYQFYISEKKDAVIGKVVKSEDIPAATQLFTPNWIVQYLVQNSVGRLWLMANPQSTLAKEWPYYITPAEQTPEVQAQLDALIQTRMDEDGGSSLDPETITCLDPACGSGHILVVAYDVLKAIYLERGYQPRAIPRLILEKNLFGLDIDDRAAQMAGFALLMKARADDRRLFSEPVKLNVLALQESKRLDAEELASALRPPSSHAALKEPSYSHAGLGNEDLFPGSRPQMSLGESSGDLVYVSDEESRVEDSLLLHAAVQSLISTFLHAKTFGSLIQIPAPLREALPALLKAVQQAQQSGDLYAQAAAQDVWPLVVQAKVLGMQFDAVVANPPYMGGKGMNLALKEYAKAIFPDSKSDLFSMFMERGFEWCKPSGFNSMVTMQSWMFLSSFEKARVKLLAKRTIHSMIHLGSKAFSEISGDVVQTTAFSMQVKNQPGYKPTFVRLVDGVESDKQSALLAGKFRFQSIEQNVFRDLPGSPLAYWLSVQAIRVFSIFELLEKFAEPKQGATTSDNARFLRYWYEVNSSKIFDSAYSLESAKISRKKWFPYNKGGGFRRWAGNKEFVINYENNGKDIKDFHDVLNLTSPGGRLKNQDCYFLENISWSKISGDEFAVRYYPIGFIFDVAGSAIFHPNHSRLLLLCAALNSKVSKLILRALSPTVNFEAEHIRKIPVAITDIHKSACNVTKNSDEAIGISSNDWDLFEESAGFSQYKLIKTNINQVLFAESWESWKIHCNSLRDRLKVIEEENNQIFINAYGFQNELTPEVPESQITLARADREKDCQRLISYAIGCMMGRYSLDEPGLIYAHAGNIGFDANRYAKFPADADGIVPLTDELWFEDDAASRLREFLLAVWGADTLAENMAWLAESLGAKTSETPEETIRRYLADKFFKDHLQTYKKRPIYWLFSSGKQGAFQALVYLHRYNEGTLARLRAEYVVPLTGKIQSRIDMLQKDALAASSTAARNKLAKDVEKLKKKHVELLAYDEILRHHADMRITLDLDDGVKVNYGRFGNLLAEVKAVTGGKDDE